MAHIGNQRGDASIDLQSIIPQPMTAPPRQPPSSFGSATAIVLAFITGRLRKQFYSDVTQFGDAPDATSQVAAGYRCLAAASGLVIVRATP